MGIFRGKRVVFGFYVHTLLLLHMFYVQSPFITIQGHVCEDSQQYTFVLMVVDRVDLLFKKKSNANGSTRRCLTMAFQILRNEVHKKS
jgi:hypothetical protein